MRFKGLQLLLLLLAVVVYSTNAKRWFGGGSKSSSRGSSWGSSSKPKQTYSPSVSKPSTSYNKPTSFHHPGKTSSSDFLHAESGRPSRPANSAPPRSGSHAASAPPLHSFNTHSSPTHGGSSNVAHDRFQQSSSPVLNSSPYGKQPASNPHYPPPPSGVSVPSHSSAPYPISPNHPHPTNIGSSSYPSLNSHPVGHSSYPSVNSHPPSYHSGGYGAPPPYHAPSYGSSPSFHAPPPYHPQPAYQPASAPFVPGKTVYVMQGGRQSSGPGIGSIIAGGVAGGAAAGATNAIVDHAISSIFRPSSSGVHTYPSAPAPGTPTSSVTNNYYYGNAGPQDANNSGNIGQPTSNNNGQSSAPSTGPINYDQSQNSANVNPQINSGSGGNPGIGNINTRLTASNPSAMSNGAVSKTPEGAQPENIPPNPNFISDENIMMLTEELLEKQDKNLNQYVNLNLQKRTISTGDEKIPDETTEPLFTLKSDIDSIPSVTALRALYDNYQRNGSLKEEITSERRDEENTFLDEMVKTPVMKRALDWLTEHKFVESNDYDRRDMLKRMWFTAFADDTSSGFERIFLSEIFGDGGTVGLQNWIYFAHLESKKEVNYLGFVDTMNLSGKGFLIKLNYETAGFTIKNATIFAGTPPELELALYTICFHARPNNWCPVSLGGAKFFILTHSFRHYGKDLIDLAFPSF